MAAALVYAKLGVATGHEGIVEDDAGPRQTTHCIGGDQRTMSPLCGPSRRACGRAHAYRAPTAASLG